jgi:predicted ATPase/serine/threonine protein kinase
MELAGSQFGPYQVVGRLGAGGMGEVYLALDSRLDREVALKRLPAEVSRDPEQLARFRREALTLASLNHPNIATIHGFEETADGSLVLVLERVAGSTLAARLEAGPLPVEEALQVCAQIAEALEVAHERGIVHRDIKPGNVMLGPRGLVKVLDFGLAKGGAGLIGMRHRDPGAPVVSTTPRPEPARITPPGPGGPTPAPRVAPGGEAAGAALSLQAAVGTPGYMSPEQVLAGAQDARTDIFAFGCVLYECLAGRRAFVGRNEFETMAVVLHDAPDLGALPPRTPGRVRDLIRRCLEKDAEQRLADIRAARIEIEEALGVRRASALRTGEVAAIPHNLPTPLTSFVGREDAVAQCARTLRETRLLTLTGVGGCGKTRLALRLAGAALDEHRDGLWFVSLGPLADTERVPEALAEALGVQEEPGRPLLTTVTTRLGSSGTLLLLDNCEHLIGACAALAAQLLGACPRLKIVATSREPLGVPGETLFAVSTLALPAPARVTSASQIAASEAVRLFVERAAAVQPDFALRDDNAATVAEICRRLDGIPLALELAAARARVLSVEQIRDRLDDRFRLLTGGSRVALPRHQTLRAALQWSYDQLAEPERLLLRRLSTFAGGWTLERSAQVCDGDSDEFEILDLLTRLVDKSLVVVDREEGRAPRYRYLESVRQFALEELAASGEAQPIRSRHLDVFLELARVSERGLLGPDQAQWITHLAAEEENLLAALAWSTQAEDGARKGLALAGSMWRFWSLRGRYELGRRALEDALRRDAGTASELRATALVRAGGFALYQSDYAAARPLIEEGLRLYRQLGDRKGVARALSGLGVVAMYQADGAAARAAAEESLELYRQLGERRGEALALHNLGYLEACAGQPAAARSWYEPALELLRQVGDRETAALTQSGLGKAWTALGDHAAASEQFRAALTTARELGVRRVAAYALEGVAQHAVACGLPELGGRWCAAAEALREEIGSPALPWERQERAALVERIRSQLGEDSARMTLEAGGRLSFESAVTEALESLG